MAYYEIDNRPSPIEFGLGLNDRIQRTLQNAKNLLMTRKGEVPYDRLRGFDAALLDLPMDKIQERLIPEMDRVMAWEPDAKVADAEATLDANGEVHIRVVLEINDE